ncbi:MAG: hypothetical protein OEZ39_14135 [Gammaproteobacteria bacterium]|nr:hypothetical protein [Gammaproteobacteria bacterium]MDH5652991.1 hypothetical protein [Gammaproteobacteria bacterium]
MFESYLMPLDEAPDLFADAALMDAADNLLFLSLWGRDTALQEFLARLSLPQDEGGLKSFSLLIDSGENRRTRRKLIQIGDSSVLNHFTGRLRQNILGDIAHLWVFNRLTIEPDLANRRTFVLFKPDEIATESGRQTVHDRIWHVTKAICHLPMLDHWAEPIICMFRSHEWIRDFEGHGMHATLIDLNLSDDVEAVITGLIRQGTLTLAT